MCWHKHLHTAMWPSPPFEPPLLRLLVLPQPNQSSSTSRFLTRPIHCRDCRRRAIWQTLLPLWAYIGLELRDRERVIEGEGSRGVCDKRMNGRAGRVLCVVCEQCRWRKVVELVLFERRDSRPPSVVDTLVVVFFQGKWGENR